MRHTLQEIVKLYVFGYKTRVVVAVTGLPSLTGPFIPTRTVMGNFFEDLVHSVLESTLNADEQTALKVRSWRACSYSPAHRHATQAKFHKLKREVIEDVRHIFPHGQILVSVPS